jgi:hypothetical protein
MKTSHFHFPLLLSLSLPVAAGESANYSIAPQSQSEGTRSTSSNYTLDVSQSSGAAVTSAALALRGGFAGALYDVTELDVTAAPATMNEGGTRQLDAALVLDDATRLLLSPSAVTWSVLNGPATVNSTGLVTGGTVSANTATTVRGAYQTFIDDLALTVLDTGGGYNYASDSLPDDWQTQYFGNGNPNAAPGADSDGDGWDNLFEYTAGLVPTDAASRFNLAIAPVPGQPAQRRIIFSPRLTGRTYTVLGSTAMEPASWTTVPGATVSDNGDERTVIDPNAGGARKFYRVQVVKP